MKTYDDMELNQGLELFSGLVDSIHVSDLRFLEDAIYAKKLGAMVERLKQTGFQARFKIENQGQETTYWRYVLVQSPDPLEQGQFATLAECQRLLDMVKNLSVNKAFARWAKTIEPMHNEPYTEADAKRDTREARRLLKQQLDIGQIDGKQYAELYQTTSFMDLVEK